MRTTLVLALAVFQFSMAAQFDKPPFQISDIQVILGDLEPCVKIAPDGIKYYPEQGAVAIHLKQTLKTNMKSCSEYGVVFGLIQDSAKNEIWNGAFSFPSEIGNTNEGYIAITWIPSNLKLPLTIKLRTTVK